MANSIEPGTRCHLTDLVQNAHLNGRQVEVIGLYPAPAGETGGEWFALRADWIRAEFPGQDFITPRQRLRPITENAR